MLMRTHMGVSLDGFVATPNGLLAWDALPTFGPGSHGADEIASQGGPAGLLAHLRDTVPTGDVQLLGGSRNIQAFPEPGAIDRLGMVVLLVRLDKGVPLFSIETTAYSLDAWTASQATPSEKATGPLLRLDGHRAFPDGAVELVYVPT